MENATKKKSKDKFEDKLKGDSRFASITTDPKFMTVPKHVKKVKVDKRFNKMLKDKDFATSAQKDHFGKFILISILRCLTNFCSFSQLKI